MRDRGANPWIAFAAGAVAVLALALVFYAWQLRHAARDVARTAVAATKALPELERPTLPEAPRMPDVPVPRPK
jgi:uncharacterized membrane protein YqjE